MSKEKKKILICIDRINDPNSGLGRVAIEFGKEIAQRNDFEFTFLIPKSHEEIDLNQCNTIKLTFWRKHFSFYLKKFDLVHALYQSPKYSLAKANLALMTIHDLNFIHTKSAFKQKKYYRRMNHSLKAIDAIAYISNFTAQDCKQHIEELSKYKTKVIYNGLSKLKAPSPKPHWCPTGKFLFSIGVFIGKKNFHTLIPFVKVMPKDYKLIIAGNSNTKYGQHIKDLVSKEQLNDRIILPQMISEEEKSYLYHNCEAFVFPSLAEGFGLPVIEAMSVGKPVFCSDKTSLKEIGDNFAYFWRSFAPEDMKKVFISGMKDFNQEKRDAEIEYANSYTWQNNVSAYIDYYKTIIKDNS